MSVLPRNNPEIKETHKPAPELSEAPWSALGRNARDFNMGKLKLDGRVFLAPMAGYTDTAFRRLARRHGAAMVRGAGSCAGPSRCGPLVERSVPLLTELGKVGCRRVN